MLALSPLCLQPLPRVPARRARRAQAPFALTVPRVHTSHASASLRASKSSALAQRAADLLADPPAPRGPGRDGSVGATSLALACGSSSGSVSSCCVTRVTKAPGEALHPGRARTLHFPQYYRSPRGLSAKYFVWPPAPRLAVPALCGVSPCPKVHPSLWAPPRRPLQCRAVYIPASAAAPTLQAPHTVPGPHHHWGLSGRHQGKQGSSLLSGTTGLAATVQWRVTTALCGPLFQAPGPSTPFPLYGLNVQRCFRSAGCSTEG